MKMRCYTLTMLAAGSALVLAGCVERRVYVQQPPVVVAQPPAVVAQPAPQVIVTQPPPAPPPEVRVVAPGPGYVWLPGHWSWQGRWVWMPGHWAVRPHAQALWVPGRWLHRGHGYVWVEGHWR